MAAPPKEKNGPMRIDTELVRELAEMLDDNELTEIEVEDGRRIEVAREPPRSSRQHRRARAAVAAPALSAPPTPARRMSATRAESRGDTVKSPMVGTVFLSAEPGATPFIEVGASVKAGDTL